MKTKKIYFENLDGLRFLCFLSIFFFHSFHTDISYLRESPTYEFIKRDLFGNGNLGVNFFFVLSGFLITYLLIEEKKLNGQINIKRFWYRRILRIWPLFYACVAFGFVIFPYLKSFFGETPNETATIIPYLTFTNNFEFIAKGPPDASVLGVLWSIAVEEQFYFVWPIILYLIPIKRFWIAFLSVILLSLIFRYIEPNQRVHEYHTLSCIGDMALGSLAAWLTLVSTLFKNFIKRLSRLEIAMIYVGFILCYFFHDKIFPLIPLGNVFDRLFIAILIAFIILEQNFAEKSFFKMSNFKRITKLGVISYGLYCLHFIGILIATTITAKLSLNEQLWVVLFLETILALCITILISWLSYKYFEAPFLRLKSKFSYIKKNK